MSTADTQIEVLAARQHVAMNILVPNWKTVAERLRGLSGDSVEVRPSRLHGMGLFACSDIPENTLITLFPCHRVLQQSPGQTVAGALADEEDEAYFRPPKGSVSAEDLAYRQYAYRQTFSHANPERRETFLVDANPTKADIPGWFGHRINDGATLSSSSDEDMVCLYYRASAMRRNCCAVALCIPLVAFVTTRAVAEGEELLTTYGHSFWMQTDEEITMGMAKVVQDRALEVDLRQMATDKMYALLIRELEDFIATCAKTVR